MHVVAGLGADDHAPDVQLASECSAVNILGVEDN
jgi:hypothetical protein